MGINSLISNLKEAGQDHEFYPTTDEIISKMLKDLKGRPYSGSRNFNSVLDIGAGNGKVLKAFRDKAEITDLYAMEKSMLLCGELAEFAFIIGTDFKAQTLLSKRVDLTFCNPPYSEFEEWAVKIIRESASRVVYMVIPVRWEDNVHIAEALKYRQAKCKNIGEFSFEYSEDRKARAVVNLLRIELSEEKDDAFQRFFDERFSGLKERYAASQQEETKTEKTKNPKFGSLVGGNNILESLVNLYNDEMDKVRKNYELAAQLDVDLLKELHVKPDDILKCLKMRLDGLRSEYWRELFSHMTAVTNRVCTKRRNNLLHTLNENGHVDFTAENAYAVILWILKSTNHDMDAQLVEVFERMISKANIRNYKSNQKVLEEHQWRYNEAKPTHVALEYRLVLQHCGGIKKTDYSFEKGLDETGCEFIRDLLTVAYNLGFICKTDDIRLWKKDGWRTGQKEEFYATVDGKEMLLFEVKAFYNWNIHIRLGQKFALALNVEHGRLKGWLNSPSEAAEELQEPSAAAYFGTSSRLGFSSVPLLQSAV